MIRDPVCLMVLDPRQAKAMVEHNGRTYYFCSEGCKQKFLAQPELFLDKASGMRLTVGVMGSASGEFSSAARERAYVVGRAIAERGFILITGACPGLPYECARGAREQGGLSVGISPALSLDEHVHKYLSPADVFDVLIYTGSGLMGREVTNIRSSDMVVIVGGRSGTLGEFAIAYDEGKLIGILQGTGGITGKIGKSRKSSRVSAARIPARACFTTPIRAHWSGAWPRSTRPGTTRSLPAFVRNSTRLMGEVRHGGGTTANLAVMPSSWFPQNRRTRKRAGDEADGSRRTGQGRTEPAACASCLPAGEAWAG